MISLPGDSAPIPGTSHRYARDDHGPHGNATWYVNAGPPAPPPPGLNGDLYLDNTTGDVYQLVAGAWVLVANILGPVGPVGPPGAPGAVWYVNAGPPAPPPPGLDGDFYLDNTTGDVYQLVAGAWVLVANILGPAGPPGPPGSTWYYGAGAPAVGLGFNGDWYLDTASGAVYSKVAGAWVQLATIPFMAVAVSGQTRWGLTPAVGVSPNAARQDHNHGSQDDDPWYRPMERPVTWQIPNPNKYTIGAAGDFATITAALASPTVLDGDTLAVLGEVITEPAAAVVIAKRVKIDGNSAAASVIEFPTGVNAGFDLQVTGFELRDVTLRNSGAFVGTESLLRVNAVNAEAQLIIEDCIFEYYEEALTLGVQCGGCQVRRCTFTFTGPNTNNAYMVRMVGTSFTGLGSRWRFEDLTVNLGLAGPSRVRCLYLTGAGDWAGELLCSRWLVQDAGANSLRSLFLQDNFGAFVPGNVFQVLFSEINAQNCGDAGGTIILYPSAPDSLRTVTSLTVRRCNFKNSSGKGMVALDAAAPILPPLINPPELFLNDNSLLNPAVTAPGYATAMQADQGLVGYATAIFGVHP